MRQRHGVFFVWDWKSALYARSLTFARFFSSSPLFFQFFCDIFCLGRVSPPLTSMLNAYKSLPHVLYVQPSAPFTRDTQNEETKNTKCVVCVFLFLPLPLFFCYPMKAHYSARSQNLAWMEWEGDDVGWKAKFLAQGEGPGGLLSYHQRFRFLLSFFLFLPSPNPEKKNPQPLFLSPQRLSFCLCVQ